MFPLNKTYYNTRKTEKHLVTKAKTNRLAERATPYMQRLLNENTK